MTYVHSLLLPLAEAAVQNDNDIDGSLVDEDWGEYAEAQRAVSDLPLLCNDHDLVLKARFSLTFLNKAGFCRHLPTFIMSSLDGDMIDYDITDSILRNICPRNDFLGCRIHGCSVYLEMLISGYLVFISSAASGDLLALANKSIASLAAMHSC